MTAPATEAEVLMHAAFFKSAFDNRVERRITVDHDTMVTILTAPFWSEVKDTWMITPALFRADDDEAATRAPVKDGSIPINPRTGRGWVQRAASNVEAYSYLVLDVDNGSTRSLIENRFRDHEYVAHTTWSHLADGRTPKYRVWFPLAKMMPVGEYASRRESIQRWFGLDLADLSTTSRARGFYLPSFPRTREALAEHWTNTGRWVDWASMFAPEVLPERRVIAPEKQITGSLRERYLESAIQGECRKIAAMAAGGRHDQVVRSASALGGFVASGSLDGDTVMERLLAAALAAGMEGREAELKRTIRDGLGYAQHRPRSLPEDVEVTPTERLAFRMATLKSRSRSRSGTKKSK